MSTTFTHAFVALACGGACFGGSKTIPARFWLLAPICSVLPDLDVGLHAYGVEYGDLWGHRGMTHSLLFAVVLSFGIVTWFFRSHAPLLSRRWWALFAIFVAITASHGFLDAFTNGGLGVAFFSPFDTTRYFMPWTPIQVSAFGLHGFIKYGGLQTLISEALWIWLPGCVLMVPVVLVRTLTSREDEACEISAAES